MTKRDLSVRAVMAALMLLIPNIVGAQAADPVADRAAIEKVMYDYVAAYGDGDMDLLMQNVQLPLTVGGPNGFRSLATSDEAVAVYTKIRDAGVKQGYAKSEWLDFGVKLLGPSYAIALRSSRCSESDRSDLTTDVGCDVWFRAMR